MKAIRYSLYLLLVTSIIGCSGGSDEKSFSGNPSKDSYSDEESVGAVPEYIEEGSEGAVPEYTEEGSPAGTTDLSPPDSLESSPPSPPPPRNLGQGRPKSFQKKKGEYDIVRVFYGTNRDKTGSSKPDKYYGNQRDKLTIGHCDVSIPRNHVQGNIERPKIWKFEFRENPKKHIVLLGLQQTDTKTFLKGIHKSLDESYEKEMFIFIHGYNVKFRDAALRTAQIAHDLDFDGVPMMFSWPASGHLEDYVVDEATSNWAKSDAYRFILAMAKFGNAKKIHVIAHSMGNRVLTGALDKLSQQVVDGSMAKINQVILTAPDIDADTFKNEIAPKIVPVADRITIYASSNDRALKASKILHGNSRLGLTGKHLSLISLKHGIDVVDASQVDTSLFGHSYYGDNITVLDDIEMVFKGNQVQSRGLVAKKEWNAWSIITKKNPFKALLRIQK